MLRLLFVTGSLVHGGAERHTITVMNRLAERGHDCHAVYVKDDASQLMRIDRHRIGSVHCLHAERFLGRRALGDFAAYLARLRPSAIIAANGYALMYASLARRAAGCRAPLVATFHSTAILGLREQIKTLIDRLFFWQAHCTVFVCERQKRYWLRRLLGSRRNMVIHNGVDTGHFRDQGGPEARLALRRAYGFAEDDYVVGIPAVLRPEKNHLQLVDAAALVCAAGIPLRILMIGDGPQRNAVEVRSRTLGVDTRIRITGFVEDVRPCLSICDAVVLCSLSETFSLAALEAMAMGKPVIHSDVGGAAEMVFPERNGYLFTVGSTEELADRLLLLADRHRAARMGGVARGLVEARFSEGTMIDRYEDMLVALCANHPDAAATTPAHAVGRAGGTLGNEVERGADSHENV